MIMIIIILLLLIIIIIIIIIIIYIYNIYVHRSSPYLYITLYRQRARVSRRSHLSCAGPRRFSAVFGLGGVLSVQSESPCVVLWRPEALDCRVLIPPEAFELAYP
jgi:hypothetical protein